jgi:hypothetical protein
MVPLGNFSKAVGCQEQALVPPEPLIRRLGRDKELSSIVAAFRACGRVCQLRQTPFCL